MKTKYLLAMRGAWSAEIKLFYLDLTPEERAGLDRFLMFNCDRTALEAFELVQVEGVREVSTTELIEEMGWEG